jgi:hypothetical protein
MASFASNNHLEAVRRERLEGFSNTVGMRKVFLQVDHGRKIQQK